MRAGGVQEALTDVYNDQLRQLREAGAADTAPEVREAVKAMRDEERSIEGAPQVCVVGRRDRQVRRGFCKYSWLKGVSL